MAVYAHDDVLSEDLRIRITPAMRRWLEDRARAERRTLNNIIRYLIEDAIEASHPASQKIERHP